MFMFVVLVSVLDSDPSWSSVLPRGKAQSSKSLCIGMQRKEAFRRWARLVTTPRGSFIWSYEVTPRPPYSTDDPHRFPYPMPRQQFLFMT